MKPIRLTLFDLKDRNLPQLVVYLYVVGYSGLLPSVGDDDVSRILTRLLMW